MRRLPPLNAIRAFEATGRLGGVQRASEELYVTHGAVSRHVKQLENWLNVVLFDRSQRSLILNSAGEAYLKSITSALDLIQEGTNNIHRFKTTNILRISTTHSIATKWLMEKLPDFSHLNPDIEISLSIEQQITNISNNNIDIGLRMGKGPWPGLKCFPLMSDELIPVCSSHLLKKGEPIKLPQDLASYTLLHDQDPKTQWKQWFKSNNIEHIPHTKGPRFSSSDILLSAAMSGQGIALVNKTLAEQDISQGRLIQVLPHSIKLGKYYWLVTKISTQQSSKIINFIQWIKKYTS
ncbi:MAG: transcriptional regulator GcvA [Alcanivoracaceae bacterium]|nr:transcriptional regulator GcvA [Alcanivoracaceae bacterium]